MIKIYNIIEEASPSGNMKASISSHVMLTLHVICLLQVTSIVQ